MRIAISFFIGYKHPLGVIIALTFCMGKDLQSILQSPIQQPMATVSNMFYLRHTVIVCCRLSLILSASKARLPFGLLL